jgi:TonB family protein
MPETSRGRRARLVQRRGTNAICVAAILAMTLPAREAWAGGDEPRAASGGAETQLVPPQLEKFVEADYPPDAQKAGIEGDVTLALEVDISGNVTGASVQAGAGSTFDEAALLAAKRFVFKPATRGGKPIAARILYKYSFTLKAPADPTASDPAAAVARGRLHGTVRMGSEGPLDGAKVLVTDAQGKSVPVTTKSDGTWEVSDLLPGKYRVTVFAEGYDTFRADEDVAADQATDVVYRLKVTSDGTAEITVRGEPPPREVTRRELSRRELSRIPGTNGDALRAIQSLPGVARAPRLSGLLIVRGSAPQDTQIFIDGTPVPIAYHFGGFSSVVPTESIEKIDFYPGNFSAQYGRAMGGVVDVKLREQENDRKPHAMAQVDLIDARAMVRAPLGKDWTFFAAGRRSHIDAWIGPILESGGGTSITSAPVYYDYQAFLETKPTSSSRFRVGYFGSDDRLKIFLKGPVEEEPAIAGSLGLHTGFGRAQALYENQVSSRVRVRANAAYGYDATNLNAGVLKLNINTNPLSSRAEVSLKATEWLTFNIGEDLLWTNARVQVRAPPPPRPGEADPGPINTRGFLVQNTTRSLLRPGAYAETELQPTERLRFVAGGRMDYSSDTSKWDPSVRTSGRLAVANEFPKTTAKAGWGTFTQAPQAQETDSVFGSLGLRSNRATHYSVGAEQEITRHIDLSLEGYYKDLSSIVSRLPTPRGNEYFNTGSGYVGGMEVLLRYKADDKFFGWIAYTLSRSMRRNQDSEGLELFQYDQPHILTALGSYKLGKGWEVGARFRFVSGPLYTPCTGIGGYTDSAAGSYECITGRSFSQRLGSFHQLDVRVDKTWDFKVWKLSAYLDLYNAYNHQAPEDLSYNFNKSRSVTQGGLPIIPSLGLRAEF